MDRRDFLKAAGAASLYCFLPGFQAWAAQTNRSDSKSNKLVVLFLRGAVDGLSVVVPCSDPAYYSARRQICIQKPGSAGGALPLDRDFGLHPILSPLMPYWQDKKLAFVLNSGSPDPTRSHFDAQDYMESGVPGKKVMSTGWLERLLLELPDNKSPIRAINIGSTTPRIFQGPVAPATYAPSENRKRKALDNPEIASKFGQMYEGRHDELERAFLEGMDAHSTIESAISEGSPEEMKAANQGAVQASKFNGFGKQLGKLMREQPAVQVAFLALGGFDTHVNQGSDKGQLAGHLGVVANGLAEFITALGPSFEDTTIMVISEFGRTVKENGNGGTDHGHGNAIWLLGGKVNGGKMYGRYNGLAGKELYEGRDLPVTMDFRTVIGSVTGEQLRLSDAQLRKVFPDFEKLKDKSLSEIISA